MCRLHAFVMHPRAGDSYGSSSTRISQPPCGLEHQRCFRHDHGLRLSVSGLGRCCAILNYLAYSFANTDLSIESRASGTLHAGHTVLALKFGALLVLAPPCSSYSWMCRYSSGRRDIMQDGFGHNMKVYESNVITARSHGSIWWGTYFVRHMC